jgi:hypothetical protein
MLRLTAIKAVTSETVLDETLESLIDFVREVQQKDASIYTDYKEESAASYKRNLQGLL